MLIMYEALKQKILALQNDLNRLRYELDENEHNPFKSHRITREIGDKARELEDLRNYQEKLAA